MYQYATFQMGRSEEANQANQKLANQGNLFGIEVTIPALAALCTLGNLDPQHGEQTNMAACVAALTCELPPAGATLVTVRPDADSIAAMAVLERRANLVKVKEEIVHAIGEGDCTPNGPWVRNYRPPLVFSQASALAMDHIPLHSRVTRMYGVLGGGHGLLPEVGPNDYANIDAHLNETGTIAVALADGPGKKGACGAGYRLAPVVVALNEAFSLRGETPHRKFTVARWNATHVPMDWAEMLQELQALEPGWGGSSSICGSPQGKGSTLTLEQVVAIVERHLA